MQSHVAAYRAAFWPVCLTQTHELPGLRVCLDQLRGRVKLGIATSRSERGARYILDGFGFGTDFEALIALEHVQQVKPHPEAVLTACALLGVQPTQTLMVGDTPDDMRAGRDAGAVSIGVTTGAYDRAALLEAGAQEVLSSLAGLPGLMEIKNKN